MVTHDRIFYAYLNIIKDFRKRFSLFYGSKYKREWVGGGLSKKNKKQNAPVVADPEWHIFGSFGLLFISISNRKRAEVV